MNNLFDPYLEMLRTRSLECATNASRASSVKGKKQKHENREEPRKGKREALETEKRNGKARTALPFNQVFKAYCGWTKSDSHHLRNLANEDSPVRLGGARFRPSTVVGTCWFSWLGTSQGVDNHTPPKRICPPAVNG